ncbi:MAG: archease [Firmicutes bacterium]|jgi:SHS2 domain-containing protein|nr:archease [Bacillota bacterium]
MNAHIEMMDQAGDAGFRITARSLPALFEGAGLALSSLILPGTRARLETAERLSIAASDLECLLVSFLNELIFLFDHRTFVAGAFDLSVVDSTAATGDSNENHPRVRLLGETWGELLGDAPADLDRRTGPVPKGVSYHLLEARQRPDGLWYAQFVIDT